MDQPRDRKPAVVESSDLFRSETTALAAPFEHVPPVASDLQTKPVQTCPVVGDRVGFAPVTALPDPSGGIVGFTYSYNRTTRIDARGKPSWSIRPQGVVDYDAHKIAVHPDGTIFMIAHTDTRSAGGSEVYVIGIDGSTGSERFRVPLQSTLYSVKVIAVE